MQILQEVANSKRNGYNCKEQNGEPTKKSVIQNIKTKIKTKILRIIVKEYVSQGVISVFNYRYCTVRYYDEIMPALITYSYIKRPTWNEMMTNQNANWNEAAGSWWTLPLYIHLSNADRTTRRYKDFLHIKTIEGYRAYSKVQLVSSRCNVNSEWWIFDIEFKIRNK